MPGCPAFFFFPRFKAYTQVNAMMWDARGNDQWKARPRSPPPRFPVPWSQDEPRSGLSADQSRSTYPEPFVPLGLPDMSQFPSASIPITSQQSLPRNAQLPAPPTKHPSQSERVVPPIPPRHRTRTQSGPSSQRLYVSNPSPSPPRMRDPSPNRYPGPAGNPSQPVVPPPPPPKGRTPSITRRSSHTPSNMPTSTTAPTPFPNFARPPSPYTPVQPLGYTYSHRERHNSSSSRQRRYSDAPPPPPPKHHPGSGSMSHRPQQLSSSAKPGTIPHASSSQRLRPPHSPVPPAAAGPATIHHSSSSQRLGPSSMAAAAGSTVHHSSSTQRLRPSTTAPNASAMHHPASGAGGAQHARTRPQGVRFNVPEPASIRPTVTGRHPHRRASSQPVVPSAPAASAPGPSRAAPQASSSKMNHPNALQEIAHLPFQYSRCTGRKKALLIGINYIGQKRELKGCINDVKKVQMFLIKHWGYKLGDIVMLMDETTDPRRMPTRKNMIDGMKWLVQDAQPHDSLFFHYSGHGGQVPDKDGDEVDGLDEVIYPLDYKKAGIIVDDEMNKIMVKTLPSGCRLTAIFDSCHSGTALDLPYIYHSDGRLKGTHITPQARIARASKADVISFSGCRDDQTSADTTQGGVAVGAMSWAFRESLAKNKDQSYQGLLKSVRGLLKDNYKQKPQLSSSHPIDTTLRFIM